MSRIIRRKIADIYRKNKDDVAALFTGKYPEFVFRHVDELQIGQIPVFTFHSVEPQRFEQQLKFLAENRYKTIDSDHLCDILTGTRKTEKNTVLLTFDDGRGSLWTTAYPLLKKYGFIATAFIVPNAISNMCGKNPNLEDVWSGRAALGDIHEREKTAALCDWQEILTMSDSNVIDFQSHTSYHNSVYVSNDIIDFINPDYAPSFLCSDFNPVLRQGDQDVFFSELDLGLPVYRYNASMAAKTRFLEDDQLSKVCIDFVKENGGKNFFNNSRWRKKLKRHINEFSRNENVKARYQTELERYEDVRQDLYLSKKIIEQKLQKSVQHLCYPWYLGSPLAVQASKEVGYRSNHWGIEKKKAINRVGDDPYCITRINDDYLFSLPGKGRMSLMNILKDKAKRLMK